MAARGEAKHQRGRGVSSLSGRSASPALLSSASSDTDSSRCPTPVDEEEMDIGGLSDSVKRFEVSSPVTPRPVAGIEGHHFANEPFVHRQLVQGRWKTIIHCPKVLSLVVAASMPPKLMAQGLDPDEWIAVHLVDFVKNFSMCHELVASSGHCSINSCPTMTIGPGTSCAWRDQPSRAAPLYNDAVLTWIEGLVNDPLIFPVKAGRAFSEEFRGIAKRIWACLADLWCHLVFEHYDIFLDLSLEAYVNSLLAHFCIFGLSANLVTKDARILDRKDSKGFVLGHLLQKWITLGIVPRELR